jgi:hypothetical protein
MMQAVPVERRLRVPGRTVILLLLVANTLFVAAALAFFTLRYPALNWDMIPYTALTIGGDRPASVHAATFDSLRRGLPLAVYEKLTADRPYRRAVAEDPQVLANVVAFYAPRPLYLAATRGLAALGVEPYRTTYYVPLIGMLAATFLTLWPARGGAQGLVLVLAPWSILAGHGTEIARSSTPDGLAFPITMLMFFAFSRPAAGWARLVPALLSVAARHDLVLLVWLVYALAWGLGMVRWREVLLACAASALLAATIAWWYDYPGWRILFYNSFIEPLTVVGPSVPLSIGQYLTTVAKFLIELLNDPAFWLAALLTLSLLAVGPLLEDRNDARAALLLVAATVAFFAIRCFLYPLNEGRFFGVLVALNALWLLRSLDALAGAGHWWPRLAVLLLRRPAPAAAGRLPGGPS